MAGKPVPLQAGHFSSFGFDLIGFMGAFSTLMANEIRRLNARVAVRRQKLNFRVCPLYHSRQPSRIPFAAPRIGGRSLTLTWRRESSGIGGGRWKGRGDISAAKGI